MGRITSVTLMSVSHGLVYQRGFEAIREMQTALWPIDPGGTCLSTSKVVRSMMGGMTRSPTRMMPRGQARKDTCGKTCGRKPPQCPY